MENRNQYFNNSKLSRFSNLNGDNAMEHTFVMPSRKRQMNQTLGSPPSKLSYKTGDLCDNGANPSFVSCPTFYDAFAKSSVSTPSFLRVNAKLAAEIQQFYPSILEHLTDKNQFFAVNSLMNFFSAANIVPGKRVLAYDEFGGLVTVSALKLLKGEGQLWFLFEKFSSRSLPAFKAIESGKEVNAFHPVRLSTITTIVPDEPTSSFTRNDFGNDEDSMDCEDSSIQIRPRRLESLPEKIEVTFDSLIIVSDNISPVSFLEKFYNFLIPSATISIFTHSASEAEMVQAFLIAMNAKDITAIAMPTYLKCPSSESTKHMGSLISAIKLS